MPKVKKIPMRMCVGCQEMKPKKQLIRIVRTPDEKIEIDPTGKRSGRGVYICPESECLNKAIKGKRLEKALQRNVGQEVINELKQGLTR
ncbi:MAG TPA: YlxR family protein [Bacillota bacterium]|mgnify:CR=1 FL=1|nr:YlxR family protein [Bacillota bacterium]